jgi:hypothetical protein
MPTPPRSSTALHTHFGALVIGGTFLGVLLAGTLWKLTAAHLTTSASPLAQQVGAAMFVQYG